MVIWDILRYYDGHFEIKESENGQVLRTTVVKDEDIVHEMDEAYRACNAAYFRVPTSPPATPNA